MEKYTIEQRVQIIKIYYQNNESVRNTFRALREFYGRNARPAESTIRRLVNKFESSGTVTDTVVPVRQRNARSEANIAAVNESVRENPTLSISRRSQELGLSETSTWRILREDLSLHPYKIQLTQELKPNDHSLRRRFADWALEQLEVDVNFDKKIIFSDEAHFWLNGFVNKQNCRIWGESNPQQTQQLPMYPGKLTVWCGLWSGGIIGPFFFKNDAGNTVTVNGVRYRAMINDFVFPEIDDIDTDDIWFQQDGATCHTAKETINLLKEKFGESIISRNGPVNWPPRSCDLTPLDFFLWGYVKSLCYANKPQTIDALQENIEDVIAEIQPDLCERVIENWVQRIHAMKRSRGGHLNDIVFHT